MHGRVLTIAGSDSSGGAGIQADIKTITALGGYAASAITALTAQDTCGVHGVLPVPPGFVAQQIGCVLGDIGADAIKTGMLHDAGVIHAVADALAGCDAALVVDPVMVSTSGRALLDPAAVSVLKARLVPRADLITPNLPEAAALTGMEVVDRVGMVRAATELLVLGPRAVLVKGGHLPGDQLADLLMIGNEAIWFEDARLPGPHTHGTGCTLASAIATFLAQGTALRDAVPLARAYLRAAIAGAPGLGRGHGPLNHMARFTPGVAR